MGQISSGYIVLNEHTFVELEAHSCMTLCKNSVGYPARFREGGSKTESFWAPNFSFFLAAPDWALYLEHYFAA